MQLHTLTERSTNGNSAKPHFLGLLDREESKRPVKDETPGVSQL